MIGNSVNKELILEIWSAKNSYMYMHHGITLLTMFWAQIIQNIQNINFRLQGSIFFCLFSQTVRIFLVKHRNYDNKNIVNNRRSQYCYDLWAE